MLSFLADPNQFPNAFVNAVCQTCLHTLDAGKITHAIGADDESMLFQVSYQRAGDQVPTGMIVYPPDYLMQVQNDLVTEVARMAYLASHVADFGLGLDYRKIPSEINAKAMAHEAEALITLKQMARRERVRLRLKEQQQDVLDQFPKGLEDLPYHLAMLRCPIHRWIGDLDSMLRLYNIPKSYWRLLHELVIERGKHPLLMGPLQMSEHMRQINVIIERQQLPPDGVSRMLRLFNNINEQWGRYKISLS